MTIEEYKQQIIDYYIKQGEKCIPIPSKTLVSKNVQVNDVLIPLDIEHINNQIKSGSLEIEVDSEVENYIGWNDYSIPKPNNSEWWFLHGVEFYSDRQGPYFESQGRRIAVLGEQGSGKTMFCRRIASALFSHKHIYFSFSEKSLFPILIECNNIAYLDPDRIDGYQVSEEQKPYCVMFELARETLGEKYREELTLKDFMSFFEGKKMKDFLLIMDDWDALLEQQKESSAYKKTKYAELILKFVEKNPELNILITTKKIIKEDAVWFYPLDVYIIKELSEKKIRQYCRGVSEYADIIEKSMNELGNAIILSEDAVVQDNRRNISKLQKIVSYYYKNHKKLPKNKKEFVEDYLHTIIAGTLLPNDLFVNEIGMEICLAYTVFCLPRCAVYSLQHIRDRIEMAIRENHDLIDVGKLWEKPYRDLTENNNVCSFNNLVSEIEKRILKTGLFIPYLGLFRIKDKDIFNYLSAKAIVTYTPECYSSISLESMIVDNYQKILFENDCTRNWIEHQRMWDGLIISIFGLNNKTKNKKIVNILKIKGDKFAKYLLLKTIIESDVNIPDKKEIISMFYPSELCTDTAIHVLDEFAPKRDFEKDLKEYIKKNEGGQENRQIREVDIVKTALQLSNFYCSAGDYYTSLRIIKDVLKNDWNIIQPDKDMRELAYDLCIAAKCSEKMGNPQTAIRLYRRVLSIEPLSLKLGLGFHVTREAALLMQKNKMYEEALELFEKIKEIDLTDFQKTKYLGVLFDLDHITEICQKLGKYQDGFQELVLEAKLLSSIEDPGNHPKKKSHITEKMVYFIKNNNVNWKNEQFEAYYISEANRVLRGNPEVDEIRTFQLLSQAIGYYQNVLEADKLLLNNANSEKERAYRLLCMADTYAEQGYRRKAKKCLQNAGHLKTNNLESRLLVASVYAKCGYYKKAYSILRGEERKIIYEKTGFKPGYGYYIDEELVRIYKQEADVFAKWKHYEYLAPYLMRKTADYYAKQNGPYSTITIESLEASLDVCAYWGNNNFSDCQAAMKNSEIVSKIRERQLRFSDNKYKEAVYQTKYFQAKARYDMYFSKYQKIRARLSEKCEKIRAGTYIRKSPSFWNRLRQHPLYIDWDVVEDLKDDVYYHMMDIKTQKKKTDNK